MVCVPAVLIEVICPGDLENSGLLLIIEVYSFFTPSNEEFIELLQKPACKFLKLCRKGASYTLLSSVWLQPLTRIRADSNFCRKVNSRGARYRQKEHAHAFSSLPWTAYICSPGTVWLLLLIWYDLHHQGEINRYSLCSVNWDWGVPLCGPEMFPLENG